MGYESETDTFFYLSGIEGEDLSFMSFSYYPQDTQKDCNYLGKVRINLLPLPDSDFTLILPSCKVIICLHKLSPIPEPDVLVVKKGTNILSRTSGKIPSPLSDTVRSLLPAGEIITSTRISLSDCLPQASRAFFNIFEPDLYIRLGLMKGFQNGYILPGIISLNPYTVP